MQALEGVAAVVVAQPRLAELGVVGSEELLEQVGLGDVVPAGLVLRLGGDLLQRGLDGLAIVAALPQRPGAVPRPGVQPAGVQGGRVVAELLAQLGGAPEQGDGPLWRLAVPAPAFLPGGLSVRQSGVTRSRIASTTGASATRSSSEATVASCRAPSVRVRTHSDQAANRWSWSRAQGMSLTATYW